MGKTSAAPSVSAGGGKVTRCRSCGSPDLRQILSLGDMPLADALLTDEDLAREEPKYPLDVAYCRACSLVQILYTVPPETLFSEGYLYFSSFSDALLDHSRRNAESLIRERALGPESLVVEVASNDGYLLKNFSGAGVPVLGIDPAPGPAWAAESSGIPTLRAFFDRDLAITLAGRGIAADVIVANNVLAHVADLNGFVVGLGTLLKPSGIVVIEVPYVRDLIERCEFDTIYHEHLCYFSVAALMELFRRNGLAILRVEHFPIHGGSLRLTVGRPSRAEASVARFLADESAAGMLDERYYEDFASRVSRITNALATLIEQLNGEGARLAAYGAAAKGATLLNATRIASGAIEFVVDRNVHKQGRYMPGVHLPIRAPEELLVARPSHVLLLAWNFKEEILQQQHEYRRRGGKFIIPIPYPAVT